MNKHIVILSVSIICVSHTLMGAEEESAAAARKKTAQGATHLIESALASPSKSNVEKATAAVAQETDGMSFFRMGESFDYTETGCLAFGMGVFRFLNNTRTRCHLTCMNDIGAYQLDAAFSDGTLQPLQHSPFCMKISEFGWYVKDFPRNLAITCVKERMGKLRDILNHTPNDIMAEKIAALRRNPHATPQVVVPAVHSLVAHIPQLDKERVCALVLATRCKDMEDPNIFFTLQDYTTGDDSFVTVDHGFYPECTWCEQAQQGEMPAEQRLNERLFVAQTPHQEPCLVHIPDEQTISATTH